MHTAKRQLRIWGHELTSGWAKVPFYGRLALGASVSLILALMMVKHVIKPLNADLARLQKGLEVPENLDPAKDEEIIMALGRTERLQGSIESWQKRVDAYRQSAEVLNPKHHLTVLSDLQSALKVSQMALLSETLYDPVRIAQEQAKKSGRSARVVKTPPPVKHGPLSVWHHDYVVRGSYRQIQVFIELVKRLPWRIELTQMKLVPAKDRQTMDFTFRLAIYYLEESK